MGMFDSFCINCPVCKNELEFQSKTGECLLNCYRKNDLTPLVAVGIDGDIVKCQFCNKNIQLVCKIPKKVKVKLIVTKERFNYSGNFNKKHPISVKRFKELNKRLGGI